MTVEQTHTSATIVQEPVLLADQLRPEMVELAERFGAADVADLATILADPAATRLREVFYGSGRSVGAHDLVATAEALQQDIPARSLRAVLERTVRPQFPIQREIGELAAAIEADPDSDKAPEQTERMNALLEELAALMMVQRWLESLAPKPKTTVPRATPDQQGPQPIPPPNVVVDHGEEVITNLETRLVAAAELLKTEQELQKIIADLQNERAVPINPDDPVSWNTLRTNLLTIEATLATIKVKMLDPAFQAAAVNTVDGLAYSFNHVSAGTDMNQGQRERAWKLAGGKDAAQVRSWQAKLSDIISQNGASPAVFVEISNLFVVKRWALNDLTIRRYVRIAGEMEREQNALAPNAWPLYLGELRRHIADLVVTRSAMGPIAAEEVNKDLLNKMQAELTAAQGRYADFILRRRGAAFPGLNPLNIDITTQETPVNQPRKTPDFNQAIENLTNRIDALWTAFLADPNFTEDFLNPENRERIRKEIIDVLKARLVRISAARAERDQQQKTKIEVVTKNAAYGGAARFFEAGIAEASIPDYENLKWMEKPPKVLACAIFNYVRDVIMENQTKKDEVFVQMDIMGSQIDVGGHNITIGMLLDQFKYFGLLYPNDPSKRGEFEMLGSRLAVDFPRISQIFKLGNEIHNKLKHGNSALEWLQNEKEAVLEGASFRRMFRIGEAYIDPAEQMPWGRQLYYAMQINLFQNEPTYERLGVLSTSPDDAPVYIGNVRVKSPITDFPTVSADPEKSIIDQYFQRNLIARIASGETPSWKLDPEWGRRPDESLSALGERRLRIGRRHLMQDLYGLPDLPPDADKLADDHMSNPNSYFARCQRHLRGDDAALTPAEKAALEARGGYFPQQMATLLAEYFLLFAKAEGVKKKGRRQLSSGRDVVVVDGRSGPTSEISWVRAFNPQQYSRKLRAEGGGYGSPGPVKNQDVFYGFLRTYLDRYAYCPDGEKSGASLRDLFLVTDSPVQFAALPFEEKIIEAVEGNGKWNKLFAVGLYNHGAIAKGLGITWHNLVETEAGTEGAVISFNAGIAQALATLARQGNYLLEQDFGRSLKSWSKADYEKFRVLEKWYEAELAAGRPVAIPAQVTGNFNGRTVVVNVDQAMWDSMLQYRKRPTDNHEIFDGTAAGDMSNVNQANVTRYAATVSDFMWIPPEGFPRMNRFEEAVLRESAGDYSRIFMKLYVGGILIGDISKSGTSGMDAKDAKAFQMALSYDYFKRRMPTGIFKKMIEKIAGRTYNLNDYAGVGFFTPVEVEMLMKEANVPSGIILTARETLAVMQTFGK